MRENIISFPCDVGTHNVIKELQRRFAAQGPGVPVSRSFAIRWAICKGAEHYFNSAEFHALMKGKPVKTRAVRAGKKKRSTKARRTK